MAIAVIAFSLMYGPNGVPADAAPQSPPDLLDPRWKGQIASSCPNDDNAVLYLYSLYLKKYGWEWAARQAAQDVRFARGSHSPANAVRAGQFPIGVGGSGAPLSTSPVKWVLPDKDIPFVGWGQRTAVLRQAAKSAAAKL